MHHPWAQHDVCPIRPPDSTGFPLDWPAKATAHIFPPTDCKVRYEADGSPTSDLVRDRIMCSRAAGDCQGTYALVLNRCDNPSIPRDKMCWMPPTLGGSSPVVGGLFYGRGGELVPTVYTVLATGCDRSTGKCKWAVDKMRREYADGTRACAFWSVRNQGVCFFFVFFPLLRAIAAFASSSSHAASPYAARPSK